MLNKLNREEQSKSEDAVYYFKQIIDRPEYFLARVRVFNGDNTVIDDTVKVHILEQFNWTEINIIWEDAGYKREEFRRLGLFGVYSTTYCKMEFIQHSEQLKIKSDNLEIFINNK